MAAVRGRRRITIGGIVQGVGFRPFVWRLAVRFGLSGFIRNTSDGVLIEVEGPEARLASFTEALRSGPPPLARIISFETGELAPTGAAAGFDILGSSEGESVDTLVSPDIAICPDCLRDLADREGRRYRYPFTNCTNCGPRFTIVERLPYDRPGTTMKGFELCPECRREYLDPADRRFHAQPNACPQCGPKLVLHDATGLVVEGRDPLVAAAAMLASGAVVAVKGVGGVHLAVDAFDDAAVRELRRRKGREEKPFAVMVRDLEHAEALCSLTDGERQLLGGPEAPILLLPRRPGLQLAPSVAPGNDRLGVMLPYTPLHRLLLDAGPAVLVMTSGNLSEEPLVADNAEALERLSGIADAFLLHDRPIAQRCDDSVAMRIAGRVRMVRRSRGYVPAPIFLRQPGPAVLSTGGELKTALCLMKGAEAIMSQHIGDMRNYAAYLQLEAAAAHLQRLFRTAPELVAHDLHPSFLTTQWAQSSGFPTLGVQHHHAHLAAVLAEHRHDGPAIGIILDGSGFGTDGTIWGGEVLVGDAAGAARFASLEPMPLAGGDAAVRQVWRLALGYLHQCGVEPDGLPCAAMEGAAAVSELLVRKAGCVMTSSCGRLFDAVASICGIRQRAGYEGQAAVELMQIAGGRLDPSGFSFGFERSDGRWRILLAPMLRELVASVRSGMPSAMVSRRFHRTLVCMFSEMARMAYLETGIRVVALGGGVFQNPLLVEALVHDLETNGFQVLLPELVPVNDGGISLGQGAAGRAWLAGAFRGVVDGCP